MRGAVWRVYCVLIAQNWSEALLSFTRCIQQDPEMSRVWSWTSRYWSKCLSSRRRV